MKFGAFFACMFSVALFSADHAEPMVKWLSLLPLELWNKVVSHMVDIAFVDETDNWHILRMLLQTNKKFAEKVEFAEQGIPYRERQIELFNKKYRFRAWGGCGHRKCDWGGDCEEQYRSKCSEKHVTIISVEKDIKRLIAIDPQTVLFNINGKFASGFEVCFSNPATEYTFTYPSCKLVSTREVPMSRESSQGKRGLVTAGVDKKRRFAVLHTALHEFCDEHSSSGYAYKSDEADQTISVRSWYSSPVYWRITAFYISFGQEDTQVACIIARNGYSKDVILDGYKFTTDVNYFAKSHGLKFFENGTFEMNENSEYGGKESFLWRKADCSSKDLSNTLVKARDGI